MKTALSRFLVRWYQASDQPLPAWLERACRRDATLSREQHVEQRLTSRLRSDVRPATVESSAFLKAKVLRELSTASAKPKGGSVRWFGSSVTVACSLALGVLVAALWLARPEAPSGTLPSPVATTEAPSAGGSRGLPAVATLPALVRDASWENPLDKEMDRVMADALGAVRFVASSFLPSEPPPQAPLPKSS